MRRESNSDLFGHRKGFLSAGVHFWGETSSAADIWKEALEGQTGLQPAQAALLRRSVGVWTPCHILQTDIPKNRTVVCVLVEQALPTWEELEKGTLGSNCLGANTVARFSHEWYQHPTGCYVLAYVSATACFLEFAFLQRSRYSSLLPSNGAIKVRLSWNFRVRWDFNSDVDLQWLHLFLKATVEPFIQLIWYGHPLYKQMALIEGGEAWGTPAPLFSGKGS